LTTASFGQLQTGVPGTASLSNSNTSSNGQCNSSVTFQMLTQAQVRGGLFSSFTVLCYRYIMSIRICLFVSSSSHHVPSSHFLAHRWMLPRPTWVLSPT
jgi:hypothetical protein